MCILGLINLGISTTGISSLWWGVSVMVSWIHFHVLCVYLLVGQIRQNWIIIQIADLRATLEGDTERNGWGFCLDILRVDNGIHLFHPSLTIISEPSWHPSNIRILIQMPQQKICANFQTESPSQIYSLDIQCTVLHAFVCVWYLNCDLSLFSHLQTSKLYCH